MNSTTWYRYFGDRFLFLKSKTRQDTIPRKMGNAESNTEYDQKSIFDFTVKTLDGQEVSLSTYKGKKAYLLVNVASQ